jgi:hypothetical protein
MSAAPLYDATPSSEVLGAALIGGVTPWPRPSA